jgi:hypothetical protein
MIQFFHVAEVLIAIRTFFNGHRRQLFQQRVVVALFRIFPYFYVAQLKFRFFLLFNFKNRLRPENSCRHQPIKEKIFPGWGAEGKVRALPSFYFVLKNK